MAMSDLLVDCTAERGDKEARSALELNIDYKLNKEQLLNKAII